MPQSPFVVNVDMAALFFGVSTKTISRWVAAGCPKVGRGKYDLQEIFAWWRDNMMASKVEEKDETLAAAKLDYWQGMARVVNIKADKQAGELIDKRDVAKQWAARMAEVASGLQALPMRLPPLLEGKSQGEMRGIIENEQWRLRDNFCRTGKFCVEEMEE